ncbi:MAG: prolipoprotein diacylglyceryl transferase, partial [Acidobacteria bacterium]|nr:prolipoprotein diacylglyceryl transferase [Acidobacteriota bacterium]
HYADVHLSALGAGADAGGAAAGALAGALVAGWHMPAIHPAQIYSMVNALLLALVLHSMWRWKRQHGQVILAFVVLYGASRFLLEMIRADEAAAYLFGLPTLLASVGLGETAARLPALTISQNVAVAMVVGGGLALVWLRRRPDPTLQASYVPPPEPGNAMPNQSRGKRRKDRRS